MARKSLNLIIALLLLAAAALPVRAQADALRMGPLTVGDLAELLSLEMANTSHHLGVLRANSIVLVEKQGRHRVYRLNAHLVPNLKVSLLEFGCCRLEMDKAWKPAGDECTE